MKLKKLFAGVVAAAMIATMSFPAFAAMGGSATVNNDGNCPERYSQHRSEERV